MRLDRQDAYLTRFVARVAAREVDDSGTWLRLDRSAFYPTAGGQPHDTGQIEGLNVLDVEARNGEVWHRLAAGPAPTGGDEVVGQVDWNRRYRHMQRHSAQHMLSQAFIRVGARRGVAVEGEPGYHTRSVSMRGPDCTLDLTGEPDDAALAEAEAEVNAAARRAMPVLTFDVPDSRLTAYRLRRPAKVTGLVRLVAMGDYDLVACGGTHVRNMAETLPIAVLGWERVRGGLTRVTFRAGVEALDDAALKRSVVRGLTQLLSAQTDELPSRVDALTARVAELEGALAEAARLRADVLAGHLIGAAGVTLDGDVRLVAHELEGVDSDLFDPLVDRLQREPRLVSVLGVRDNTGARVACLAGPDADVDVRPALKAAIAQLGGRGGGRPDRAQGAGPDVQRLEAALAAAATALGA